MEYLLGILTGLVLAVIILLAVKRFEKPIERTIKQLENKVKEKGEIFVEDEDVEDFKAFINNLPKE